MRVASLVLGIYVISSFASATTYPLTITDDTGATITIKSEPKRIISMLPSHTETIFALGASSKLVGIDMFSNYPKAQTESIKKVGSGYQPDIEAIIALKPDLVFADEYKGSRLVERLAAAGITVYGGTAQTYNEVFEKIAITGKLINRETNATKLITSMRSDLNRLKINTPNNLKQSVYYEIDPTPYSVGEKSYIGTLIDRAGGKNIVPASLGDFPKLDPEFIIKANPQIMIGLSLEDAKKRPSWSGLSAVVNSRVYLLNSEENDALSRPGPRMVEALKALIKVISAPRR